MLALLLCLVLGVFRNQVAERAQDHWRHQPYSVCEFVFFIAPLSKSVNIYIVVGFRVKPNLHREFQDNQGYRGRPCSKQNRRFYKHCLQKALFFTIQTRYVS